MRRRNGYLDESHVHVHLLVVEQEGNLGEENGYEVRSSAGDRLPAVPADEEGIAAEDSCRKNVKIESPVEPRLTTRPPG